MFARDRIIYQFHVVVPAAADPASGAGNRETLATIILGNQVSQWFFKIGNNTDRLCCWHTLPTI